MNQPNNQNIKDMDINEGKDNSIDEGVETNDVMADVVLSKGYKIMDDTIPKEVFQAVDGFFKNINPSFRLTYVVTEWDKANRDPKDTLHVYAHCEAEDGGRMRIKASVVFSYQHHKQIKGDLAKHRKWKVWVLISGAKSMNDTLELSDYPGKESKKIIAWLGKEAAGYAKSNAVKEEEGVDEGKTVTIKRKYTDNHPAKTIGAHGPIRNRILEFVGKRGEVSHRQMKNFFKKVNEETGKMPSIAWVRRHAHLIDREIKEGSVTYSLTKRGKRVLEKLRPKVTGTPIRERKGAPKHDPRHEEHEDNPNEIKKATASAKGGLATAPAHPN